MGRVAGVTATETRERLLRAAADAFAAQGYDGTRVADIAASAGVSNGALYAHFGSKAELLVGALRAHGRRHLADMFDADPGRPVTEMLLAIGRRLGRQPDAGGYLLVEALVAARRDEDVARPMASNISETGRPGSASNRSARCRRPCARSAPTRSSAFEPKCAYRAPLLTPALAAMSATRVPSYPWRANASAAARSSRSRVSVAVTPATRPMKQLKNHSFISSRTQGVAP